MPPRTPKACRVRGCRSTTTYPSGFCEGHKGEGWKQYKHGQTPHQRGYGTKWETIRAWILKRDKELCQLWAGRAARSGKCADMLGAGPMKINPGLIGVVVIAGLSVALVKSFSDASSLQSDNDVLRSDNSLQGQIIATQAFNFNRFNQVAEHTNRLNSLIDTGTEETVIEYREILRREKNL